jgi:hypothetical protein
MDECSVFPTAIGPEPLAVLFIDERLRERELTFANGIETA